MDADVRARARWRLVALVSGTALIAAAMAQQPAALGLMRRDPHSVVIDALAWVAVGSWWLWVALEHSRTAAGLWRAPSALFSGGVAIGGAAIVLARVASAAARDITSRGVTLTSIEAVLFELGVVALASLTAFAGARSLLRPLLGGTTPPLGAREISLRTRIVVATTGTSFATAGILLNVLVDFETTSPDALAGFIATAAALVASAALIGWLVAEDTARGVEGVTRRMRDLARAERGVRVSVPLIAADEVGDLTLAASELERRIRDDEASAARTAERERIARELHDGVAKSVSVLALEVGSLSARASDDLQRPLGRVEHLARLLAEELRAIVHEFRTGEDREPFGETVRRIAESYEEATIDVSGDLERVGALARFEIARVLEEALRNAHRHAGASRIAARVAVGERVLELSVEDDGAGIGPVPWSELAARGHFGLLGIRERAYLLGGEASVGTRANGGTRLMLRVPVPPTATGSPDP